MIAQLRTKLDGIYCNNCFVKQQKLKSTCSFCGASFSNYEDYLLLMCKENEDGKRNLDWLPPEDDYS